MSELDLSSVINLIMENPELVNKIKSLAEEGGQKAPKTDAVPTVKEAVKEEEPPRVKERAVAKRAELLRALSPYISDNRKKAIETFMSIADILDLMRAN